MVGVAATKFVPLDNDFSLDYSAYRPYYIKNVPATESAYPHQVGDCAWKIKTNKKNMT